MLDVALEFLVKSVNAWLVSRTGSEFGQLQMSPVVDEGGKWVIPKEHVGVTLINFEEERVLKSQLPEPTLLNGHYAMLQPELKLNLQVLFAANFTRYDQALKQLSAILTYFQARPSFKREEYPALDSRIERLSVELASLGYEQLNQVWAFIGAKQLPSAIYKVRMLSIQDVDSPSVGAPITDVRLGAHQR